MTSLALRRYPPSNELPRWIGTGAIAGAVSVLVFHQGALALLYAAGLTGRAPYSMELTAPWGIPSLVSLAAVGFGAVLPTLVALILVAPLKGQPTITGVIPLALLVAVLINGAWGLGTGLGLALFGRRAKSKTDRRPG